MRAAVAGRRESGTAGRPETGAAQAGAAEELRFKPLDLENTRESGFGSGMFQASRATVDAELIRQHRLMCARVDGYFGRLMVLQWLAALVLAAWAGSGWHWRILAWAGDTKSLHPHIVLALVYGGALTLLPLAMTRWMPGEKWTRLTIA